MDKRLCHIAFKYISAVAAGSIFIAMKKQGSFMVWAIWILCILSRLPQLLSENLVLDGDECVVAIMAKHMYVGKEFPLFFYGQQYGFSFVEELFILPFYAVIGVKAIAVKCAMLLLWSIGVVFLYKALLQLNKGKAYIPALLIALLGLSPAWAVWSMKARGGYLTAFTLSSILLCMVTKRDNINRGSWIIAGLLLVLIYESMLLWLPGMLLICVYYLYKQKNFTKVVSFTLPAGLLLIAFHFYRKTLPDFHHPDATAPMADWLANVWRVPEYMYTSFQGNYFFFDVYPPNFFQAAFAAGFCTLVLLVVTIGIIYMRKVPFLAVVTLAILMAMGTTILSPRMHYRYLLPVTGYTILALQLVLNEVRFRKLYSIVAGAFIVSGIVSVISFKDFHFTVVKEKSFLKAIHYMEQQGIYYTYCHDQYLVWQLIFYSNEKVLSREMPKGARYPEYHNKIDAALNSSKKTALIGFKDDYFGLHVKDPVFIDYIYVKENFPKAELDKNFDF
jgi:hypothetical protein